MNTALLGVTKSCLTWYQRLDPALNNASPPSSPTSSPIDPEDGTVAGSSKGTRDQASSDTESSRENMDDSDMETTSGDCVSWSDTDDVSIQTANKKYQRRVWASCRLNKGNLWTEAQLKRIGESHQDVWGHHHESIRTEWKHTLVEDHNSFEM